MPAFRVMMLYLIAFLVTHATHSSPSSGTPKRQKRSTPSHDHPNQSSPNQSSLYQNSPSLEGPSIPHVFIQRLLQCPSKEDWSREQAISDARLLQISIPTAIDAMWLSVMCNRILLAVDLFALIQTELITEASDEYRCLMGISTRFSLRSSIVDVIMNSGQSQQLDTAHSRSAILEINKFLFQQNLPDTTPLTMLDLGIILQVSEESIVRLAETYYLGAKRMCCCFDFSAN